MQRIDLAGEWQLSQDGKAPIPGRLPGSIYLDYMAAGMPDPFWGMNEIPSAELSRHNYTYSQVFEVPPDFLAAARVDLTARGLDTLCAIVVNGRELGRTDNIYRAWRFSAKPLLKTGENTIELKIDNPFEYIAARQKKEKLPGGAMGTKGMGHLRKTPCHFGWDWGPALPPAGLIGAIALESFETRIEDMRILQKHSKKKVELEVTAYMSSDMSSAMDSRIEGKIKLRTPDGEILTYQTETDGGRLCCSITVDNPQLWWCNGLGVQPLYHLELSVSHNGKIVDTQERQIGLRTVTLDTAPDKYGAQFRFVVNGIPVFAKGANWIPADSFITRVTHNDIDFYIESARRANMNMLRVWGGGMYESEDFYDACDRNGILVWQDFVFACGAYPLYDRSFLDNVHAEVADNVRRIRHRASLALWCGNNENEFFAKLWRKGGRIYESNMTFYHHILRDWVRELDGVTPYWPGSPSAGGLEYKLQSRKMGQIRGDSHLWQIWHGMLPIEGFRKLATRFCSEFGMESMPSMHTVRAFTDAESPGLFDPVMQLHQKSHGGNEKILFYLLAKYRNPAAFEDFIYLSQLAQADTVRFATDCWRRNMGLSNGSLFWQFNDCWPVASWSGIDYKKQLKAVTYKARHFNKALCLSNDYYKNRAELYVINEYPRDFCGTLEWTLCDFFGNAINSGICPVSVGAAASARAAVLPFAKILKGHKKEDAALLVKLIGNGQTLDEKYWLLVADKNARLPRTSIDIECSQTDDMASVVLCSPVYARHVFVEAEDVTAPWSDNFFDIPAGRSTVITARLPQGIDAEQLRKRLRVKSLADVKPKNSKLIDKWIRFLMVLRKGNFVSWLIFKLV